VLRLKFSDQMERIVGVGLFAISVLLTVVLVLGVPIRTSHDSDAHSVAPPAPATRESVDVAERQRLKDLDINSMAILGIHEAWRADGKPPVMRRVATITFAAATESGKSSLEEFLRFPSAIKHEWRTDLKIVSRKEADLLFEQLQQNASKREQLHQNRWSDGPTDSICILDKDTNPICLVNDPVRGDETISATHCKAVESTLQSFVSKSGEGQKSSR